MNIVHDVVDFRQLYGYISFMLKRNLTQRVHTALQKSPAVLINGARQTGKSTLVQQIIAESKNATYFYFTLDDLNVLNAVQTDPQGFIANLHGKVAIDEIQRAPELLIAIKAAIDRERQPGRFLLTGSANILFLPKVAESLAGRMEIYTLWPFSQGEIRSVQEDFIDVLFTQKININAKITEPAANLIENILGGSYPEIQTRIDEISRSDWFRAYVTTVIHREIRDLTNIEGLTELPRLLALLAARTGTLLNFAELSRSIALPQTTLKRYLALLETIFLVFHLPAWSNNLSKRIVKTPKIFLNDTGLVTYLRGLTKTRLQTERDLLGALLENFVVAELCKQSTWSKTQPNFFHYRNHSGQEIDLLLENTSGQLVGIEIKAAATVTANDFKTLRYFAEELGTQFLQGIVLYTGDRIVPFGENLFAVPVQAIWQPEVFAI